ncbi:hypothetical protein I3760_05G112100 [Carya illinoinensis]|nr:hypothetical protein I3760_05G112100 [Carya illinoinensis]
MTSSSFNFESSLDRPLCYCGILLTRRISGWDNNFGRRFYNCPNYKVGKQCDFFEWIDVGSEQNACCKMLLELAQRRNEWLHHEYQLIEQAKYKAMENKYKRILKVLLTSWLLFFAIVAIIFMYPKNINVCRAVLSLK